MQRPLLRAVAWHLHCHLERYDGNALSNTLWALIKGGHRPTAAAVRRVVAHVADSLLPPATACNRLLPAAADSLLPQTEAAAISPPGVAISPPEVAISPPEVAISPPEVARVLWAVGMLQRDVSADDDDAAPADPAAATDGDDGEDGEDGEDGGGDGGEAPPEAGQEGSGSNGGGASDGSRGRGRDSAMLRALRALYRYCHASLPQLDGQALASCLSALGRLGLGGGGGALGDGGGAPAALAAELLVRPADWVDACNRL